MLAARLSLAANWLGPLPDCLHSGSWAEGALIPGGSGRRMLLGGHTWQKLSSRVCCLGFSWACLGVAPDLQRWHAHPLCGFDLSGQPHSSLAASGLHDALSLQSQTGVLSALKLEWPHHLASFLPSKQPSALEGLHSSPPHHKGSCRPVSAGPQAGS